MCDPGKADNSIDIGDERPAKKNTWESQIVRQKKVVQGCEGVRSICVRSEQAGHVRLQLRNRHSSPVDNDDVLSPKTPKRPRREWLLTAFHEYWWVLAPSLASGLRHESEAPNLSSLRDATPWRSKRRRPRARPSRGWRARSILPPPCEEIPKRYFSGWSTLTGRGVKIERFMSNYTDEFQEFVLQKFQE